MMAHFVTFPDFRYRSCLLGWWFHLGVFYEKAIEHLKLAFLSEIDKVSDMRTRPSYPPLSAADILRESHQKLVSPHEWQAIYDLDISTRLDPDYTYQITDYIENHPTSFLVHIFKPTQTTEMYFLLAIRHFRSKHFQRCVTGLLSALKSSTSVKTCNSCRDWVTILLLSLTQVLDEMDTKESAVKTNSEIAISAVIDLFERSEDAGWNLIFWTWRHHLKGMNWNVERLAKTFGGIGVYIPRENLHFLVGDCGHYK
ncbi:hypothetical protein BDZ45DRAFT_806271 [Acephala macrosclerotiorum]|nr:hypothetical protein BDZ45DRAFT_806271 [Acephala macrosclerotiorum]